MSLDRWSELVLALLVATTYIAKTLYEQSRTIREERQGAVLLRDEKTAEGVSVRSRELVNIVTMADLMSKLADGQIKMQDAITHLTTVIEERLPSRRR